MRQNSGLFDELVASTGLSPVFAKNAVERALKRAGTDAERLTAPQLERSLPELERTLRLFLSEDDTKAAMRNISQLASRASAR